MPLLFASLLMAVSLAGADLDERYSMVLGAETRSSKVLLGEGADALYGLQLTPRDGRICQARAFFRGASPRTARYCDGRVTGRVVSRSAVAVLGLGERVQGVGVCLTRDDRVAAVRFYTAAGASVTAQAEACAGEFDRVMCHSDWGVQGLQLYFGRSSWLRPQPALVGVRALCAARNTD